MDRPFDPIVIRADFPLFERDFGGRSPRLSRQRGDVAQASRGARRRRRATTPGSRPTSTAASTPPPRRPPPPTRERARPSPATSARPSPPRSCSCATRPRPSTSSRTRGGADTSARRTPSCSPSWSTTRTSCPGSCWPRRRTRTSSSWPSTSRAGSTCAASRCSCGRDPSWSRSPRSRTRWAPSTRPARWPTWPTPQVRWCSSMAHRRVPHGPVDVQCPGRRLLRVLGSQDARTDRLGRALGTTRAARGDAPVHGWRRDDPRGPPPPDHVQRRALEVRGGHPGHRGGHRAGRRDGVSGRVGHGPCPGARARPHRIRPRDAAARGARDPHPRPTRPPTSGPASSPSRCPASTRTTSRRCWTGRRSPSARATTAHSRSTSASASRRRAGRASTSTPPATTSTGWPPACARSSEVFGEDGQAESSPERGAVRYPVVSHG